MSGDAIRNAPRARLEGISVDRDAEVPVGLQLTWALRSRIAEGGLASGERLPPLRDLAEATGLNVNTIRAVYQRLEQEGLLDSHQGSGTFVAATPGSRTETSSIAASAAAAALASGVDPRQVAAALYMSAGGAARQGADAATERRRALRIQIGALERTLAEMEAAHPGLAPAPNARGEGAGGALLSAGELEDVRSELVRRIAGLQARMDEDGTPPGATAPASRSGSRTKAADPEEPADPAPAETSARKRAPRPRASGRPAAAGT